MLHYQMSRVTRKPDFCLCENKGADQLRSNCEADQRLCFRYTDSTLSLLIKSEISSFYAASGTGHVGMLPSFYRTFTQNEDVITSNKCLKYNYPTKTQKAYTYGWFDLKCFLGRLRQARLTSNQSAVYLALPEGTSSLYLFL